MLSGSMEPKYPLRELILILLPMHLRSKMTRIFKPASNFDERLKDKTEGLNPQCRDLGPKTRGYEWTVAVWRLNGRPRAGAPGKKALGKRDRVDPNFREIKMLNG
jgi:hypothetical protein